MVHIGVWGGWNDPNSTLWKLSFDITNIAGKLLGTSKLIWQGWGM